MNQAVRVVLVRHGESTFNVEKRIQGRSDLSQLTARGIDQAQAVRQALGKLCVDAVFASPLQRAWQTAQTIVEGSDLSVTPHEWLREVDVSEWEGLTFSDVKERFPQDYLHWHRHPERLQLSGRYPIRDLWGKAAAFWQQLPTLLEPRDPEQRVLNILIVGHSGINRALIGSALGLGYEHYQRLGQDNCAISVLNFPQGLHQPAQLESLNLTGHLGDPLPPAKGGGTRLLLVRHGETQWNREQRFQGQMDIPLNELGRWQAAQVATFLQHTPLDLAFSSPLQRPWATAEAICAHHTHLTLIGIPELAEICHGEWEGKFQHEIEADYPGMLSQWQCQPHQVQMPAGENLHQVWERTAQGWQQILQTCAQHPPAITAGVTALVVAHDATNKALICQLFGLDASAFWAFKQGNAAVTVIDYPDGEKGGAVLRALNITSHFGQGILDCTAAGAL
ncbi:MAG: histidine phosphatase family protein [Synechococcales cyanobacterium]